MGADISDLLKIDDRLDYGWREAKVRNGYLEIKFPHLLEYKVRDGSRVEDGIWYLEIEHHWGIHPAMIDNQSHRIPKGVKKIIIDKVIEIDKEKWTTNFEDVLKSSSSETDYLISVFVKPENEKEMDLKLNEIRNTRSIDNRKVRGEIIDNAYANNMNSLRDYISVHAISNINMLEGFHGAICKMKTKDILELLTKDYINSLIRADI